MKIPLIFLGTGQAVPTTKRNHTAILLKYSGENILVDCGEGTQRQFRKAKLNPCKITRILITHFHGDHVLGLPGLFQTLALNGYNKTLEIYIPKGTRQHLDLICRMFVWREKLKIQINEISEGKFLETEDFFIEAMPMQHDTPCLAYSFKEKDKLRIKKEKLKKYKLKGAIIGELVKGNDIEWNGKKIKAKELTYLQKGKKIVFILDTKLNENCYKIAKDADLLICEGVYIKKDKELAGLYNHLTAEQAAAIAKKSEAKKLILTHLSQRYENNFKIVLNEAKKKFKNSFLAEDFMKTEV